MEDRNFATFIIEPSSFDFNYQKNTIHGMYLQLKKISSTDIKIIFKMANLFLLKAILSLKFNEWFNFKIFVSSKKRILRKT
jgi:uncharacterized membrane protein